MLAVELLELLLTELNTSNVLCKAKGGANSRVLTDFWLVSKKLFFTN